jgi:hypothetical protein
MVLAPDKTAAAVDGTGGGRVPVSTRLGTALFCVSSMEVAPGSVILLVVGSEGVLVKRRLGAELEAEGRSAFLAIAARMIRLPALSCLIV